MNGINAGLLLLRVAVGLTMVAHGYNHVFRGGRIKGTAGWFGSLGMKPGILHAWLASLVELFAGAALVLGFLTPLAAGALAGTMVVALIINHRKNGFFIFRPGEGWEYVMNLAAACLALGAIGPGEWSLDHAFDIKFDQLDGWAGLIIAAAIGIGGGIALLVVFWRPEAPKT
ncbi:MAG: putative rane protein [Actinomycetia bacterium]|nr:putative rane protein [Actinomycetes bacterium]